MSAHNTKITLSNLGGSGDAIRFLDDALFFEKNVGFCPGTTIDIVLRTDTIEHLPEEREDLQW